MMVDFFNRAIKPEIQRNYLSHLKTAVEDLVNRHKIESIKKNLQQDPELAVVLNGLLDSKVFRPFSIILVELPLKKKSRVTFYKFGCQIHFQKNLEDKQKRILIAHELAHVALKYLPSKEPITISEDLVNLFAMLSMYDKNVFYKNDAAQYLYETPEDIVSDFALLCNLPKNK